MIASVTDTQKPLRRFKPNEIFPMDGVRINNTALRDWQQSVASGRESTQHMLAVAPQLDAYYGSLADNFPGAAEAGGGTVPRMDVVVRNEDPFEHIATLKAKLPNTPLMALIRSDAGAGMEEVAQDVLEGYLLNYHKAGIDVFRNFHARNDPRAFVRVAKILHDTEEKNGFAAHFQAAYSYATNPEDPMVYNARRPVTFFKNLVKVLRAEATKNGLDQDAYLPHSLVIKDPSGVLTPEMAESITKQVKLAMKNGELPERPFGIHTHNQMGHAAETYKAAVKEGANFIDCAPEAGGYGAQPSMLPLVKELGGPDGAGLGFTDVTVFQNIQKNLENVDKLCEAILKSHDKDVRQNEPDETVPKHCIAGGQASVARAEVKAMLLKGKPEGTEISRDKIDEFMLSAKAKMPEVRKELGMPCLVTPTADYIFREAAKRANGGDPNKGFYCGYRRMMTGEMGPAIEPVDEEKQKQALLERIQDRVKRSVADTSQHEAIKNSPALVALRDVMFEVSEPVRTQERFEMVRERIEEIEVLQKTEGIFMDADSVIKLATLKGEYDTLAPGEASRLEAIETYNTFLRTRSGELETTISSDSTDKSSTLYHTIMEAVPELKELKLPVIDTVRLIKSAAYTSIPVAELLPPGLPKAKDQLEALAAKGDYLKPENEDRFTRDAVMGRMLRDPYAPDPDKLIGEFFKKRDGLMETPPAKESIDGFISTAKFTAPISPEQLQSELTDALIKAERYDSAVNIQFRPAKDSDPQTPSYQIRIPGVEDPLRFGLGAIKETLERFGGELVKPTRHHSQSGVGIAV